MGAAVDLRIRLAMAEGRVTRGEDYLRRMQAVCDRAEQRGEKPSDQQLAAMNELRSMQAEFIADLERLKRMLADQAGNARLI